ncbi:unnamed protein product, partial [Brugia pahangi]|uniref:PH domain-containing protein n=1 Tax=Brugia pahangi TaxID=6280 RepID=A0A0N4T7E1_BRUPA
KRRGDKKRKSLIWHGLKPRFSRWKKAWSDGSDSLEQNYDHGSSLVHETTEQYMSPRFSRSHPSSRRSLTQEQLGSSGYAGSMRDPLFARSDTELRIGTLSKHDSLRHRGFTVTGKQLKFVRKILFLFSALSNGLQQIPLQTQLQALFPGRIAGLPQLLYPTAAAAAAAAAASNPLMNTLNGLQNTTSLAGAGQVNTSQTQQQYIDYATLAAVAAAGGATTATAQNPFSLHPAVSAAGTVGLEQYAYMPYGLIPANNYAAQLTAAQSQLAAVTQQQAALEHQRV